MKIIVYEDANEFYRLRKENEGCSIYMDNFFIEGNDALFYIFSDFKEYGVEVAIKRYIKQYNNIEDVKNDLSSLCDTFEEQAIFKETCKEVRRCLSELS